MTKSNIEYNLKRSPYIWCYEGFKFYFSSFNHLDKFITELPDYVVDINISLSNRFKFETQLIFLPLLAFYIKVETRGFYITLDGEEIEWQDLTVSDGGKRISKNFLGKLENIMQKSQGK